jgi:hypothetical protein
MHTFVWAGCRSVNEVICHGIPDLRPFQNGDIVNLDVTVYHRGHHADLNETYFIGEVDPESVKLVETAYACLAAAVDMCTCLCVCVCVRGGGGESMHGCPTRAHSFAAFALDWKLFGVMLTSPPKAPSFRQSTLWPSPLHPMVRPPWMHVP